jgi:nitroreductase
MVMNEIIADPDYPANKLAAAHERTLDVIRRRWSPRAFSDRAVTTDDLIPLLDAARWAASCYGEEPWRFLIATKANPGQYETMLGCLAEFNQAWAKTAPVLMLTVARKNFAHNNTPNFYALHDTGMALANLMLQATAMGLYAHGMGGFDREKARVTYAIPEDYELGAAVAIGYLGDPSILSEKAQKQELAARSRKPLNEIVFEGTWANPAAL